MAELVVTLRIPWWRTQAAIAVVHVARALAFLGATDVAMRLALWGCRIVTGGVRVR